MAVLLSLAMMFMLMLPAFAVDVDPASTEATLNKLVKKADIALPEATFKFTFTNTAAPENALPAAKEAVTASFKTGEFAKYDKNTGLYAKKKIVEIFTEKVDVMKRTPGMYEYVVTEEDPVYTQDKDELTKDNKKYNVYIRVDENGINGVWVEEDGKKKDGTEDPEKMDPNNPKSIKGCTFVDTYKAKTDDVNPDKPFDPEDAESYQFFTGNTVTGKYGDKELPFEYSVALNNPTATSTLKAYVLKKGEKPSEDKLVALEYGKIKAGITLKDGEYLVIREGLEPGTAFTVQQTANADYKTTFSLDGADPKEGLKVEGTVKADKNKKVQYVNTCKKEDKDVNPTGILIQNLPYILLAVVAVGGIVYYFKRNRKENA